MKIDDIKKEIESIKKMSSLGQVIYVTTLLLSCLAIASLSEAVYKVKGFFSVALEYYRLATGLISNIVSDIPYVTLEQLEIDALILISIAANAIVRTERIRWHDYSGGRGAIAPMATGLLVISASSSLISPSYLTVVICLLTIFILYCLVQMTRIMGQGADYIKSFVIHLSASIILFGVLAAIAEGFTKPL